MFGLSLASAASLGVVALYQAGIIRHLPDPPGRVFGSDEIDASGEAYSYLSTPDAALGDAFLTAEQISRHLELCAWFLFSALASCAAVPAALPEARLAWRHLRAS